MMIYTPTVPAFVHSIASQHNFLMPFFRAVLVHASNYNHAPVPHMPKTVVGSGSKSSCFRAKKAVRYPQSNKRKGAIMLDPSTFAYDAQAPLEFTMLSERMKDGVRLCDVSFKSPLSGKVSAYLIVPQFPVPQAGLIFGHWGEGNREEFVEEAVVLARLGFISLCLDASFRRPAAYEPEEDLPQADLQWIVDVRRAVDLLQDRFEMIGEHLGYVGHSFGASFGGVIAGMEHRIKAYVLMAGAARATEIMRTSAHPLIVRARQNTPAEAWEAMLAAEAPYDACHYIGRAAPSTLLFQFARHDDFVPVQEAEDYFALASEPKQIAWYEDCNHELSTEARLDRAFFLCEQLGLARPSQENLSLLRQVSSPVPLEE
jgi:cephalosporin-C deacetylase-like acetyl esterase